jgi:hypothetical protein
MMQVKGLRRMMPGANYIAWVLLPSRVSTAFGYPPAVPEFPAVS